MVWGVSLGMVAGCGVLGVDGVRGDFPNGYGLCLGMVSSWCREGLGVSFGMIEGVFRDGFELV